MRVVAQNLPPELTLVEKVHNEKLISLFYLFVVLLYGSVVEG